MSKTALVILHPGFEEIEAVTPIDILRRGGVEVIVASLGREPAVTGRNDMILLADAPLDVVLETDFDLVMLPGGPGILKEVRGDARVEALLKRHLGSGKLTGAICAAPLVLLDAGLLEGNQYTAHFSTAEELTAIDESRAVVEDGPLITSRGAGTATDFGLALLARLSGPETADAVAQSICVMSSH